MSPSRLFIYATTALFLSSSLWAQAPVIGNGSNLGTYSLGEVQIPLLATGGTGTYTWNFGNGTLPPGVVLRSDPPFPSWFPGGAVAGLIGVATTTGTYNFTLSVTSGSTTISQAFNVKITALNQKDTGIPDAFVGVAYSYTLSALNNAGALTFTPTSALPPGLSLSTAGVFAGTPTAAGFYNISYSISDGTDTVFKGFGLLVGPVRFISAALLPNLTRGVAYSYTLTAAGGTAPYTFTAGGLPSGLSLNSSTGVISGTNNNNLGRWNVPITVTDHNNLSYTKNFSLNILVPPVTAGYIQPYGNLDDCTIGMSCSRGFTIWNGGTAPFSWSASGLPAGMSLRFGEGVTSGYLWGGDAELWGTASATGTYNITITVTDANGLVTTQTFPLKISPLEQFWEGTLPNGTRGSAYSKVLRVLGGTGTGYTATVLGGQMPTGVTISGLTASGTPVENGFFNGQLRFTDSASNSLSITNYFNIAPTSNVNINDGADLGQLVLNGFYSRQLSACCTAVTWTTVGGTLPPGLTLSGSGLLSGTPTASGAYTFTAKATDNGNAANFGLRVFTIVVTPLNIANNFTLQYGNQGSFYGQTLNVTGGFNGLTFALLPGTYLPPGITLNTATGVISGTPTQVGQFVFQMRVTDGVGNTITRSFQLFVYPAGAAPPVSITTGANFGTFSIGPRELELSATGGNGSYSWSLVSGPLPPGYSVRADMPSYFSLSASASLGGVATTPGTYNFTLMVVSGPNSATKTFTLKVSGLALKEPPSLPDATKNVPYSTTFTAVNNAGPVTWSATNLPPGLTLNSTTGTLSGTPTASGFFSMQLTLNDGVDTITSWFQPTLSVFDIQITSPALLPSPTQFLPYTTTVTASGGTPPYTFTTSGLPNGLSINTSTGVISGAPTSLGRFGFTLTVTDSLNVSRFRSSSIVVIGAPEHLIYLLPYSTDSCNVGAPCSWGIGAVSGGTPPFAWSASGLPAGMGIRSGSGITTPGVAPGDGEIYGLPSTTGTFNVTVQVIDSNGKQVTQVFPLQVSNMYVHGSDWLPSGTRGVAYSKMLRVMGGTIPSHTVQLVNGFLPSGLNLSGLVVSGTPGENGFFGPQFLFTDGLGQTLRRTMGFSISGGTSTIGINNNFNLGTLSVGVTYNNQLSACCVPSYTWSLASGTLPPGITLTPSGQLTGTVTTAGTYLFTVQAADQSNPSNFGLRLLRIIVTPINVTTNSTLPSGNVGTSYSQALISTGGAGSVTWTLDSGNFLPPGIALNSATGVLSGTPTATGRYLFNITATDSASNIFTRSYNVEIFAAGVTPPLALNVGPNLGPNRIGQIDVQLSTSGGTPPYHYSYTPGATPIPGMRVLDGAPLPTFFVAGSSGGIDGVVINPQITYDSSVRVTDSTGTFFDRPIHWTFVNTVPLAQSPIPKATVGVFYSFTVAGYGGSGSLSWSATGLPAGLSMSAGGVVSGTPTAAGTFSPNFTVTDLSNNIATGYGYSLTVNPFAITTGGVLPQGTIGAAYSQTLSAPGCGSGCTWSLASGSLPTGITLSSAGVLSGNPTGFYNNGFLVQASGSNGITQKQFSLRINFNTIQPLFITNGATFAPTVLGNPTNSAIFVQGGTPPYTVILLSGTLPTGVSVTAPGETIGANLLPGFTYLAGRAMTPGTYTFTLQATDAAAGSTTKTFTWIVPELAFSYTSLPISGASLTYNVPYTQPLLVLGGSGVYNSWSVASGSLPPGLTLNSSTGAISGTPTNTGSFTAGIQVTDTLGHTMTQNVTLTVNGPTGVLIIPGIADSITIQMGFSFTSTFSPSGGTAPYTLTPLTAYPPGCSFETGAGVIGTTASYALFCSPTQSGDFPFTFQISDSAGNSGFRTIVVHVAPFTLFSSTTLPNGSVGSPYSQSLIFWDNTSAVSLSLAAGTALPPGLSIAGTSITGTPTAAGAYGFTLNATDSSGLTIGYGISLTISTIHITNPDVIPQQAIVNVPFTYTFTATGGGTKSWTGPNLPPGLTMSSTGVLTGIAAATGTFRITVTVTDGVSTYTRPFTLYVRYGDPPLPGYSPQALRLNDARIGASVGYQLLLNNGTPPFTWTVAPGSSLPAGLSLTGSASLSIYSPNQIVGVTYLQGSPTVPGNYSFDLIATDALGVQMRRTFTLKVSAMYILGGGLRNPTTGTPYSQQLMAVGGTAPYTFTYSVLGINTDMFPQGISPTSGGLISGTPTSVGNFGFQVTVQDSVGNTFTAPYSYSSASPSGLNITTPIPFGLTAGTNYSNILFTNQVGNFTFSVSAGALPPGLSVQILSGQPTLFGAPSVPGVYTYTLHAVDNSNPANTADRVFTVPVSPMQVTGFQQPTGNALPPGRAGTPYSYTYKITGGTPPYTFATVPIYPLPVGLSLSASGVLSGTPTQSGSHFFYFTLSDSAGNSGKYFSGNLTILGPGQPNPIQLIPAQASSAALGVPYAETVDQIIQGGVAPFTWTVASGSTLPPGMAILPGGNGVSAQLGGIPTTPGSYSFTLKATDAQGRSGVTLVTLTVGSVAILPSTIPNGVVSTPYSTNLSATGGTAPYTFHLSSGSGMPPGLTLLTNGTLSGTPTVPGVFRVDVNVTDALNSSGDIEYVIVIDGPAGAPGIDISPVNPIQLNYTLTGPAPAPLPVSISSTSAALPFTALVTGIPGASLSSGNGSTPSSVNLILNTAGLTAGTYAGVLGVSSPQSANLFRRIPVVLNVQNPPACTYSLNPTAGSTGAGGGSGSFNVSAGALCGWTPQVSDPSIITSVSGAGPGSGTVTYTIAPNPGLNQRSVNITVGGQVYTITQFGSSCSYAINPVSVNATAAGGLATVGVTTSNAACTWTASGLSASPAGGAGNGPVTLTIPPNGSVNSQVLTATIAGQTFTVNQGGINCTVGLSTSAASIPSAGGAGFVNVTTPSGCTYSTVLGPAWISVTSGNTGAGPGPVALNYSVAPNSTTTPRSGTLSVGGQSFTINQDPTPCSVTVDASALGSPFGTLGGSGAIGITANGPNCSWTASSGSAWASISPTSGTGNGSVTITAGSNAASAVARSTTLTIAGQSVGLSQAGTACTFSLGSSTSTVPFGGGSGGVTVTAPGVCAWGSSADPAAPWLTISSSGSAGTSDVVFAATPNPNASPRSGTLTVAGQSFTVTQAAAPCNYTLNPLSTNIAAAGGSSSFGFTTAASGCNTTAVSYSNWLTVSTAGGNLNSGTVNFTAVANPSGANRSGTIQFGNQTFTVTQTGAACAYSLNAYGVLLTKTGGGANLLGSPNAVGCTPTVGTDQPTFINLGALSGPASNIFTLPYTVLNFNSAVTTIRKGTISFGGQVFTVKQTSW